MITHWQWTGRVLAVASLAFLVAPAMAQEQGFLWETTAQAEIPGMPMKMPAHTSQYCAKETWTKPPETGKDQSSENCKATSFDQTPSKVTWTMACANPPMTGDGEITFNGTDSYVGVFRMQSAQMNMQINLTGKKIGTCDNPQ
jgi:hypothetical protein